MLIKIIAVGKVKEPALAQRCDAYIKWLSTRHKVEVIELRDSGKVSEGKAMLKLLDSSKQYIVAMTEEGKLFRSSEFARFCNTIDKQLVFLIGGPDGLSNEVKTMAHLQWSLSPLTFPHEFARLLLTEQLFRASSINANGKYHRE